MSDLTSQSTHFEDALLNMSMFDDDFFSTFQLPEMSYCGLENIDNLNTSEPSDTSIISLPPIKRKSRTNPAVKKSSSRLFKKVGRKLKKVHVDGAISLPNFHMPGLDNVAVVIAPNMSKCTKNFPLYAFPNFDKCDALLYLPSVMARHLNSGDHTSLSYLFHIHFHRRCQVQLVSDKITHLNSNKLLELFQIMSEVHPDSVMLMHSTKVVDCEVRATLFYKGTDTDVIFQSFKRSMTDPTFSNLFAQTRAEFLKGKFNLQEKPASERHSIISLIEYGKMEMKLSFDKNTRRVMNVRMDSEFTSIVETTI